MNEPKVSIIILPFDNYEFFTRAIESLHENTDYSNFEIIASHNPCKSEKTNQKIRNACNRYSEEWGNFKFIFNEKNLYHAKGCAKGFKVIDPESEYVLLANDDIFVPGNQLSWLRKMIQFMIENKKVATLTPSLYHLKNTIYWIGRMDKKGTHDFLHLPMGDKRLPTKPLETSYNNFSFCLIRRYLLDEIELGVDTPPHYGSDSGFADRVGERYPGMKHWVIPNIKIYHENIYYLRTNRDDPVADG